MSEERSDRAPSDATKQIAELARHERLVPIMPMVYVAWADGVLTGDEVRNIRKAAASREWLGDEALSKLQYWLDPDDPPTSMELRRLLRNLRRLGDEMEPGERTSLADLGHAIAQLEAEGDLAWGGGEIRAALEEIEDALDVQGEEACRFLLCPEGESSETPVHEVRPSFDIEAMQEMLESPYGATWDEVREVLGREAFSYTYDQTHEAYRQQVFEWLEILADEGLGAVSFPEYAGGRESLGEFVTVFQALAMFDQSLVVKFGVQFGLFGGSIYFLGSDRHRREYLPEVGSLDLTGGFAMTELGHGSNVRDLETVARYDPDSEEFVVDTPDESARKEWIGNAAEHGEMMTVFAQLETNGERYGVHPFLVRVRDGSGEVRDGVRIEDCGPKMGLNGVDNGRLWFDEVRIPREQMLDRYGEVSSDGEYDSPIPSDGKRFFTMLGTLVGGRVSVAAASTTAMKTAVTIAVRYGAGRRQFGPPGGAEQPLLDYRGHQRRLMPHLAECYALSFAVEHLKERYVDEREDRPQEVEAMAAGMKAHCTRRAIAAVQTARECCGGMGYLSENRLGELRRDIDVYATFEGDNTVLELLVARGLLTKFKDQFQEQKLFGLVRYVAEQAGTAVEELNPVAVRRTDPDHLRDPSFQRAAFEYRETSLLQSAARRMKERLDRGVPAFDAFNELQDHLIALARAHVDRVVLESFARRVDSAPAGGRAEVLTTLRDLHAMARLSDDVGWYLEQGYVSSAKASAIREQLNELCREARAQAVHLVDAFGIPDEVLAAPIAVDERTL
ncbi:MAG: acyl-CoA dehydrogenase [Bradymonadaceae bacterium]